MTDNYDDIINLPHHVSDIHPQMPMRNRAAQFAPFAALIGHEEAIRETARTTDEMPEDPIRNNVINQCLQQLTRLIRHTTPHVTITYFVPDKKKKGGKYTTISGCVKTIDEIYKLIVMTDNTTIPLDAITDIQGIKE